MHRRQINTALHVAEDARVAPTGLEPSRADANERTSVVSATPILRGPPPARNRPTTNASLHVDSHPAFWADRLSTRRAPSCGTAVPQQFGRRWTEPKSLIPFCPNRSQDVPGLASFACALSTFRIERLYSVSSWRSRPATSSDLFLISETQMRIE